MTSLKSITYLLCFVMLAGCAGQTLDHYQDAQPQLDLATYFNGPIKAWGIVQDRNGHVVRRFDVDMVGSWQGDVGTLKEDFVYYDGEKQHRTWIITQIDDDTYTGAANDIIGQADGTTEGNAMRWAYQMDLDVGGKSYRMVFDDWMFLMNDGVLVNRSYIKKFGITFAELTLFMQKQ